MEQEASSECDPLDISTMNDDMEESLMNARVKDEQISSDELDEEFQQDIFAPSRFVKAEINCLKEDEEITSYSQPNATLRPCPYCGKGFQTTSNLNAHVRRRHTEYSEEDTKCLTCSKVLKNPAQLKAHIKEYHTPGKQRTIETCHVCGKTFNQKSNLKVHIVNFHTEIDPATCYCTTCCKQFKNPSSLKRHIKDFHDATKSEPQIFTCPHCGREFNKNTNLRIHIESVHTLYDPDECRCLYCSKELKNPASLQRHIKEVHSQKYDGDTVMHVCDECGHEFKKKKDLRTHKYQAHKIDVRRCEFCFNEYKNQTKLKQHLRLVHGPSNEERCDLCNKTFKNMTRLKHHHMDVHLVEPTICPDCGKTFKNKWLMRKHQRYLHQNSQTYEEQGNPFDLSQTVDKLMSLAKHLNSQSQELTEASHEPPQASFQQLIGHPQTEFSQKPSSSVPQANSIEQVTSSIIQNPNHGGPSLSIKHEETQ